MTFGNIVLPRIQATAGWSNKAILFISIMTALIPPIWASLGLVVPFAGLRTKNSMHLMTFIGFVSDSSLPKVLY